MSFKPEEAGTLSIFLRALNTLQEQNLTKHILVQNLLTAAELDAAPRDTFINKTVVLRASVTPRSNPVEYLWDFGDGSTPLLTNTATVGYEYSHPGQYLVKVCLFVCLFFQLCLPLCRCKVCLPCYVFFLFFLRLETI